MHRNKSLNLAFFSAALIVIAVLAVLVLVQGQHGKGDGKTIIIIEDALRWDYVLDNLDELPNFRYVVENGAYGKSKPVSPTFSSAQFPAIYESKRSDNLDWSYAFIFNVSAEWNCSRNFIGELPPSYGNADTDMRKIFVKNGKGVAAITVNSENIDPDAISSSIENNDVIFVYDPMLDNHGHHMPAETDRMLPYLKLSDSNLGKIITAMRNKKLIDRSTIIIFGDHGMATIDKYPQWKLILKDLSGLGVKEENTCYWNDAGVSIRFWFRNETVKGDLAPKLADYFKNRVPYRDCFFVPDEGYLKSHNLVHKNPAVARENLGDFIVGVNVGCKLVYENVPGFLSNFEEKLSEVDKYTSMHGYLDNGHENMSAFVGMAGPSFSKGEYIEINITDIAPTLMCGMGYEDEEYYNSVDGNVVCGALENGCSRCR